MNNGYYCMKVRNSNPNNDVAVFNVIRRRGPLSRVDIAKITGLTPPAVTNISCRLIEQGFVMEDSIGESSGGRRPLLLKVNPEMGRMIALHIRSHTIVGYVVDMELEVHHRETRTIIGSDKDTVLAVLLEVAGICQERAGKGLVAVGVVLRGPVRSREGISVFSPNIGWHNIPLKYILEEKTRLPVFVENDSRALATGEYFYGAARDCRNMIMLKVSHGIGSGIILEDHLYRGVTDSAGEVGHTTVAMEGPRCSCGKIGCLESLASETALVALVREAILRGAVSRATDLLRKERLSMEELTADHIYAAADQGDEVALVALDQIATYLGIGIANMANVLNPQLVVVGGGLAQARCHIEQRVWQMVQERSFESCSSVLHIRYSVDFTENTMKGLADIVFAEIIPSWLEGRQ